LLESRTPLFLFFFFLRVICRPIPPLLRCWLFLRLPSTFAFFRTLFSFSTCALALVGHFRAIVNLSSSLSCERESPILSRYLPPYSLPYLCFSENMLPSGHLMCVLASFRCFSPVSVLFSLLPRFIFRRLPSIHRSRGAHGPPPPTGWGRSQNSLASNFLPPLAFSYYYRDSFLPGSVIFNPHLFPAFPCTLLDLFCNFL